MVEPLDGIDDLAEAVRGFRPEPRRRLGVLVDHLVPGSKESRIVAAVTDPTCWSPAIPTSTSGRPSSRSGSA